MKKLMVLTLICVSVFVSSLASAGDLTKETVKILLPERTVIPVRLIQNIEGKNVMAGQSIDFEVSRDIIIDNYILIRRGAPAYATITSAEKAGYVSQGGKLGFSMDYCKAVDGEKIYLKSVLGREAESHMGANITASVIVCPLFLLMKGKEAKVEKGTEFRAYTENNTMVEVEPTKKLTEEQIHEIEKREKEEKERLEKERLEKEKKEKEEKEEKARRDREIRN
jgi:hypothetical protein